MWERRWCRPRDDYLNRARSLSWFVLAVAVAGPTCAHQQPFNEFLAGGGGDEKVPAHFTQLHNYHRPNDFFGSLGAAANVNSASHQEPTSSEETATNPTPSHSDKWMDGSSDGGDHFKAPDPVPFEGHKDTDGSPDWEMLRHSNPYLVSFEGKKLVFQGLFISNRIFAAGTVSVLGVRLRKLPRVFCLHL